MSRRLLVALDIGGVCLTLHPERVLPRFGIASPAEIPPELSNACAAYETGKLSDAGFAAELRMLTGNGEATDEAVFAVWNALLGEAIEGMAELVTRWSEDGHRFVFFSDTSPSHLARSRELFPAAGQVPDGIYSFEAGARKPAAPMFAAFETRFGHPDLYVDDRAVCLEGGKAFDWPVWQFAGAAALEARLRELILSDDPEQ